MHTAGYFLISLIFSSSSTSSFFLSSSFPLRLPFFRLLFLFISSVSSPFCVCLCVCASFVFASGRVRLSFLFFCLRPEAAASSAPSREAAAHSPVFHRQPVATESGVSSTPPPPQLHLALDRDPVRVRAQDLSVSIQRCRCYQIIGNPFRLIRAPMISIDMIDFDWREP